MRQEQAYEQFVRPLLFSLNPEAAHDFAIRFLGMASRFPKALRAFARFRPQSNPKTFFGVKFPHPVGLAAGFDKNGVALPAWEALGFGFIEVGTVTARSQPGNPKPRIFRLPQEEALINRLGFNNEGADAVAARLCRLRESKQWPGVPVGINIGKSRTTPFENAAGDYLYSFQRLAPLADYVVLNVSSPNTPGLRSLQEHDALSALLQVICSENRSVQKPVLLKISPDLSENDVEQIIGLCRKNDISGIVATNTTLDHTMIPSALDQTGGLSGRPLREKSTAMIRLVRSHCHFPIIASGGIFDAESAREKLTAGADLLQVYTGYIYHGPRLLHEIVEGTKP